MKRERLFVMPSPFRDEFRIHGFRFGSGKKSLAIVGAMRGDGEREFRKACIDALNRTEALDFMMDTLKEAALAGGRPS